MMLIHLKVFTSHQNMRKVPRDHMPRPMDLIRDQPCEEELETFEDELNAITVGWTDVDELYLPVWPPRAL